MKQKGSLQRESCALFLINTKEKNHLLKCFNAQIYMQSHYFKILTLTIK